MLELGLPAHPSWWQQQQFHPQVEHQRQPRPLRIPLCASFSFVRAGSDELLPVEFSLVAAFLVTSPHLTSWTAGLSMPLTCWIFSLSDSSMVVVEDQASNISDASSVEISRKLIQRTLASFHNRAPLAV